MSSPLKVPSSAASYTPATLDPDLRTQINTLLIRDGHVTKIQDHILHCLDADQSNWPTSIQNHALALLRSGEVTTFPVLLRRVLEDVRHDTLMDGPVRANGDGKKAGANGSATHSPETGTGTPNLAIPQTVVEEALKVTRECLETICEVVES